MLIRDLLSLRVKIAEQDQMIVKSILFLDEIGIQRREF